jgi:putative membrane protein insertion efficiency factor
VNAKGGVARWTALFVVRAYQVVLSPFLGGNCRFHPSCSNYAIEAIERWGARRGVWLGLKRVLRCRPFGGRGYDPVPENWPERGEFRNAAKRAEEIRAAGVTH